MKSFTQQVRDWAVSKPADEKYDYHANCGCALHQFLTDRGYPVRAVYGWHWEDTDGGNHGFGPDGGVAPGKLSEALRRHPRTFGALAERLA